jgi:hypothetical protein
MGTGRKIRKVSALKVLQTGIRYFGIRKNFEFEFA